jgi:Mce-associated membrane protein
MSASTSEVGAGPGRMSGVSSDVPGDGEPASGERLPGRRGGRLTVPVVPVLAVLLLLLLGAVAFLWSTRAEKSSIRVDSYAEVLQAARSNVVDLTSFDHLTIGDDIEQARRVTTGDLREETVAELDDRRDSIVTAKAIVSTEVVGAGVTRATEDSATVVLLVQATQSTEGSKKSQVSRYRVEADLVKRGDRWLLSGLTGV